MKISAKKKTELYNSVHQQIMDARIKISILLEESPLREKVDDIMSDLTISAPQSAIVTMGHVDEKKGTYAEYQEFINIWMMHYKTVGIKMPRDGAKIKSLIDQTKKFLDDNKMVNSSSTIIEFWTIFIKNLNKTWAHNADLSTIDSKYTSLIAIMMDGKAKQNIKTGTREFINNL